MCGQNKLKAPKWFCLSAPKQNGGKNRIIIDFHPPASLAFLAEPGKNRIII